MAISTYTSPDEIRAILGVAPEEIEDVTIELPIYSVMLDEAIYDLSPTLAADYVIIDATAPQTADTVRFVNLVNTWAGYQVAGQLLAAQPMFAPKTITSDKDTAQRVDDPYLRLQEAITGVLGNLQTRILALYAILIPTVTPAAPVTRIMVVNAGLGVDPVTG